MSIQVQGDWTPEWQPVIEAFAANFAAGDQRGVGEQGAGVALYHQGKLVLNIWAGERSNRLAGISSEPWQADTLVNVFSSGKGLVATCVLQLVAQGKLELDAPVSRYWPEFAQGDKSSISVRQILSHTAGLSAFNQRIADDQIFDWAAMTAAAASETPWWTPGEAQGYAPFMYGWILGELVRRTSGYPSFNAYFQAQIVAPLAAAQEVDCHFGVPDADLIRIADTGPLKRPAGLPNFSAGADSIALGKLMKADPRGVTNRAFSNPITLMTATNSQAWRQAQIPAANAHANAPALAAIYGDLASGASKLLPAEILPLCWAEQTFRHDQVLGLPLRFSNGFMLSQQDRPDCRYGRGVRAFGHPGAGGCIGFGDPDYQLGFGYVTSRMGQGLLIDERAVKLIDAAYKVLGV